MVSLRVFGPVELRNGDADGFASLLSQPKRVGLLVYLTVQQPRGLQRRDTVLALFWPDSTEERARASLSQALHYLRRSMGEDLILARGTEDIGVDLSKLCCDALLFDDHLRHGRVEQAMELYSGEFLQGFHLSNLPEFSDWVERERVRLRRGAIHAAGKLADASYSAGRSADAVRWARRAHDLDAHGEESLRRLARLLDATGQRAEAISVYNAFAERVRRDLDAEPAPETQAIVRGIQTRKGAVSASEAARARERQSETPDSASAALESRTLDEVLGVAKHQPSAEIPAVTHPHTSKSPTAERDGKPRTRRTSAFIAGTLAVVLVAALLSARGNKPPTPDSRRVFVSAFVNRTGDQKLDALGLLVADWITEALQRTTIIEVVDPTTAFSYGRESPDAPLVPEESPLGLAAQAGAGTVVAGSFYSRNDSVYFNAKVVNVNRGTVLETVSAATGHREDPLAGAEEFRERVTGAVASALDERIATLRNPSSQPPTLAAYEAYVAGLGPFIRGEYVEALPHFRQAEERDSSFMLPRFWGVFALGNAGRGAERDSAVSALELRRHRLGRMEQHGLDYLLAAQRGDMVAATTAAKSAARLGPQSSWQFQVGQVLGITGYSREAISELEKLDPRHGWVRGWLPYWLDLLNASHMLGDHARELRGVARAYGSGVEPGKLRYSEAAALAALGRTPEALALGRTFLADTPDADNPPVLARQVAAELRYHGYKYAADSLARETLAFFLDEQPSNPRRPTASRNPVVVAVLQRDLGRYSESLATLRQYGMASGTADRERLLSIAQTLALVGDRQSALRALDSAHNLRPPPRAGRVSYGRALVMLRSGDTAQAIAQLKRALHEGYPYGPHLHRDGWMLPVIESFRR